MVRMTARHEAAFSDFVGGECRFSQGFYEKANTVYLLPESVLYEKYTLWRRLHLGSRNNAKTQHGSRNPASGFSLEEELNRCQVTEAPDKSAQTTAKL